MTIVIKSCVQTPPPREHTLRRKNDIDHEAVDGHHAAHDDRDEQPEMRPKIVLCDHTYKDQSFD